MTSASGLREASNEGGAAPRARSPQGTTAAHARAAPATVEPLQACQYCGSVLDAQDPGHKIISNTGTSCGEADALIPIGKRGTLRGDEVRSSATSGARFLIDGTTYDWAEYLLHNPYKGYRGFWSRGHWTYLTPVPTSPRSVTCPDARLRQAAHRRAALAGASVVGDGLRRFDRRRRPSTPADESRSNIAVRRARRRAGELALPAASCPETGGHPDSGSSATGGEYVQWPGIQKPAVSFVWIVEQYSAQSRRSCRRSGSRAGGSRGP